MCDISHDLACMKNTNHEWKFVYCLLAHLQNLHRFKIIKIGIKLTMHYLQIVYKVVKLTPHLMFAYFTICMVDPDKTEK